MTQEDKKILLKDLCARLPYKVKVEAIPYVDPQILCSIDPIRKEFRLDFGEYNWVGEEYSIVKPYLRPMSSMTEEELKELNSKHGSIAYFFIQEPPYYHGLQAQHSDIGSIELSEFSEIYDWLNAHHIDHRWLIEKGLALEAPEEMYKID